MLPKNDESSESYYGYFGHGYYRWKLPVLEVIGACEGEIARSPAGATPVFLRCGGTVSDVSGITPNACIRGVVFFCLEVYAL
jgi:hypothetical protein